MLNPPSQILLSDGQFERLRKIIYDQCGISIPDGKQYLLQTRLGERLEELEMEDFDQYCALLTIGQTIAPTTAPCRSNEFQEMFDRITINETSFFRNQLQLDVVERKVLPRLLQSRQGVRRLRLWSAGCSTGEEPYTLAILVYRSLGAQIADWSIEVLGTDISEKAIVAARSGSYPPANLATAPPAVVARYFKAVQGRYRLDPQVQRLVKFELHNLKNAAAARRFGTFDAVFCRNVMVYFDSEMREHCLKLFHERLADDGTLFVGHSETIREGGFFRQMPEVQAFAYTKVVKELRRGIA